MRNNESNTLYASPVIWVIEVEQTKTICTSPGSNTEGYDVNDKILDDDDFE